MTNPLLLILPSFCLTILNNIYIYKVSRIEADTLNRSFLTFGTTSAYILLIQKIFMGGLLVCFGVFWIFLTFGTLGGRGKSAISCSPVRVWIDQTKSLVFPPPLSFVLRQGTSNQPMHISPAFFALVCHNQCIFLIWSHRRFSCLIYISLDACINLGCTPLCACIEYVLIIDHCSSARVVLRGLCVYTHLILHVLTIQGVSNILHTPWFTPK